MAGHIVVREYARLTTANVQQTSLDAAYIPESAFTWLCNLVNFSGSSSLPFAQIDGPKSIRLTSYVGVIQTPCGTTVEILPKHTLEPSSIDESRALLYRMLGSALDLRGAESGSANLQLFRTPLHEWVMGQFLLKVEDLIKRGVRFDYLRLEEEQRFQRGQLNMVSNIRQPPGRRHQFHIRHDIFVPDRAENRLIRSALDRIKDATRDPLNWRLARELQGLLHEVPASTSFRQDFLKWRHDRLMAHYSPVRPWCEIILGTYAPMALSGSWSGVSLLFPMEKLFERHVGKWLRENLAANATLTEQASSIYLCQYAGRPLFLLKPDLLVETKADRWILDAKWKLLNAGDRAKNYGILPQDFYQLYVYGQKYQNGKGKPALIYPANRNLHHAIGPFMVESSMELWVLPFDLSTDSLIGVELLGLPLKQKEKEKTELSSMIGS